MRIGREQRGLGERDLDLLFGSIPAVRSTSKKVPRSDAGDMKKAKGSESMLSLKRVSRDLRSGGHECLFLRTRIIIWKAALLVKNYYFYMGDDDRII